MSNHNTNNAAHNDIRLLIEGLTTRLNALANSTDTDLDQMAELVAYIKSNKSLIDGITTSKVSVADIINNLTTNVANKPLSAAQGVAIKGLIDGLSSGKLDASKLTEAISTALAQAKASGEFDGEPGADGYIPQIGKDYWTPTDKAEIEAYIASELAKRGQLKPEFAQSLEWLKANGDTSKLYVLPDGYIYAYILTETEAGGGYTNLVPTSTDTDGSIYNSVGFKDNTRLSSSGGVSGSAQNGSATIGFVPFRVSDTIRMKGAEWLNATEKYTGHFYLMFYDADKNFITNGLTSSSAYEGTHSDQIDITYDAATGVTTFSVIDGKNFGKVIADAAYFRLNAYGKGEDLIITVNEEIAESSTVIDYDWANTRHAFVPADYEERIIALEEHAAAIPESRIKAIEDELDAPTPADYSGNVLYGKKVVVCADSFTAGGYTESDGFAESVYIYQDGNFVGKPITYPYIIAERNAMEVIPYFAGGRTLANPADGTFTNSITNPACGAYYQSVPDDVDYIIFYLGINDSHHESGISGTDGEDVTGIIPLGTVDDTDVSTFCGAWNVVLPWLMLNRPNAHIGIIVSNGCDRIEYRTATIAAAKKWGIPYLDLNGDERCPAMIRAQNPDLSVSALNILKEKWRIRDGNTHPNTAAHYFQSTFIEAWLRTL